MNNYKREQQCFNHIFFSKVLFFTLVLFFLFILIIFFIPEKSAAAKNESTGTYQVISVEIVTGDSLWSIASDHFTEDFGSIQSYISEIKRMNNLTSDILYAGNYLLVPCYQ